MKQDVSFLQRGVEGSAGYSLLELLLAVSLIGVVSAMAIPAYQEHVDRGNVAQAMVDLEVISTALDLYQLDYKELPTTLAQAGIGLKDPWGNDYEYLNISTARGNGQLRKDRSLVPINSDYDLYSKGKDGQSRGPLTAQASRDDIIRANNGNFIGPAEDF